MSEATLGLRIILNDGASPGLNMFGLGLLNINHIVTDIAYLGMMNLSSAMTGMGITAIVAGASFGELSHFVGDTVSAAANLESELAKVQNSVQGADQASDAMKSTLITLADQSIYSTSQIADGFAQLGIDGFNATQIMDGLGASGTTLAEALNSQTTPAFNLLGTALELYRADAQDAGKYTNDLIFLFYNGEKTIANVQQAIAMVGPTARQLGIDFGQLSDALALLAQDGLKGGQGAASLNYYLTALSAPIPKVQHALAALGLLVVNSTSPAFYQLQEALRAAGDAAMANHYDGTVHSLNEMFNAAVKIGAIHTDKTFMEWADSVGILNNKMFDAQGNFIGLRESLLKLGDAMRGMTEQQKADFIGQLFNVRSGRVARDLLSDIEKQLARFDQLDAIRKGTDAAAKAGTNLNTLNNVLQRLGTTWTDTMARIGEADLGPLKNLGSGIADLLHVFNVAPASVHTTATVVLLATTAFVGLAAAVATVVFVGTLLLPVLATAAPVILALVGMFAQVGAAAGVIAWGVGQATDKTSQFYGVAHPILQAVQWAFGTVRDEVVGQLLPSLNKLGINLDMLKVVGIILLAVFVAPIIVSLGILIGTILVVVTVVTKVVQAFVWFRDVIAGMSRAIEPALKGLGLTFAHVMDGITSFMFNAGVNLIKMLIGGITSQVGGLFSTLTGVADKIKGVLGFHSPPREGPLADSDTYMPNMMRMYASGISNNAHLVHNAASSVAIGLRPGSSMFLPNSGAGYGSAGGNGGDIIIPVYVGSDQVAQVVVDRITGTLKQNGMQRLFR